MPYHQKIFHMGRNGPMHQPQRKVFAQLESVIRAEEYARDLSSSSWTRMRGRLGGRRLLAAPTRRLLPSFKQNGRLSHAGSSGGCDWLEMHAHGCSIDPRDYLHASPKHQLG